MHKGPLGSVRPSRGLKYSNINIVEQLKHLLLIKMASMQDRVTTVYTYKKEKLLKMKRDVGMACQKVHKQERIKVMVNI